MSEFLFDLFAWVSVLVVGLWLINLYRSTTQAPTRAQRWAEASLASAKWGVGTARHVVESPARLLSELQMEDLAAQSKDTWGDKRDLVRWHHDVQNRQESSDELRDHVELWSPYGIMVLMLTRQRTYDKEPVHDRYGGHRLVNLEVHPGVAEATWHPTGGQRVNINSPEDCDLLFWGLYDRRVFTRKHAHYYKYWWRVVAGESEAPSSLPQH